LPLALVSRVLVAQLVSAEDLDAASGAAALLEALLIERNGGLAVHLDELPTPPASPVGLPSPASRVSSVGNVVPLRGHFATRRAKRGNPFIIGNDGC
jgi:hypothetical protein